MKYELMVLAGGGKWIDALPRSNSISWGSDKDTLAVELSFSSLYDLTEGNTHVKFRINGKPVFTGVVVKKSKSKLRFNYVCFDYSWYLNSNETIKQFYKINAKKAIEDLCGNAGVKRNCVAIPTLLSKIYKDITLNSVIDDILEQATLTLGIKYVKEMIGDTLFIRKLADYKIYPRFLLAIDLVVNSSIENMKNKILVVGSDENNNKIIANANDPKSIKSYGSFQEILIVDAKDIAKAKNMATNFLKANNKIFKDTTLNLIVLEGGEEIRANRSIEMNLKAMGLSGWYNIKSCSNSLENNQFKCALTLEW
ncbi:hypothetical protein LGL55_05855 [Clostridium tagluense]|uniref:XkdQ/YqbQ family protein n=1 Tax=Clostridium tagluense TaxID=360422 RepID=UPI001CF1CB69|nr:hypothetical protein [Clostridium tagluense]MCB2310646.1 hypothetical protein [Clostridium tagluense]MCB2315623.1 hypothetical protein [Clostridium tagluense]MCB2320477.1 hypothetical protein [Clostridium tagluense]MCB2325240.1 hypothetical protein [Clostridium tagluense]MCB2330092.1 hypothetical protein [Clostridium tagluense]